jgi:hypothetical protein
MQETKLAKIDKEQFTQKEQPVLHKKRAMIRGKQFDSSTKEIKKSESGRRKMREKLIFVASTKRSIRQNISWLHWVGV